MLINCFRFEIYLMNDEIIIKTPKQIENIRKSWKYLNELLMKLYHSAKAGISLVQLEEIAEDYMKKNNIKWAFKWYQWFPANLCLSVNDCVVHGIPDNYVLKNGDLLKIDCGVNFQWWITDSAITVPIWWEAHNPLWFKLTKETKFALDQWIKKIAHWKKIFEYSHEVYHHMKNKWFSIIEKLTGHGVGVKVHEKPHIHNYPHKDTKKINFQSWMVLAFEPITAISSNDFVTRKWSDWNLYCKNGDLWAHREYTILVTEDGYEILSGITEDLF